MLFLAALPFFQKVMSSLNMVCWTGEIHCIHYSLNIPVLISKLEKAADPLLHLFIAKLGNMILL